MKTTSRRALPRAAALCAASLLCATGAVAQNADAQGVCLSVEQNGETLSALGSAWHNLEDGEELTIEFAGGKAVVSNGTAVVATLPCTEDGAMVVRTGEMSGDNRLAFSVSSEGYSTLYSPFQLTVPEGSGVEVYAPSFEDGKLKLTSATRLEPGTVVPPEIGLVLKNAGDIAFPFTGSAAAAIPTALSGTSLAIPTPEASGQTVCTLTHDSADPSLFGFGKHGGSTLAAGEAYFLSEDGLSFVPFSLSDGTSGVSGVAVSASSAPLLDGKYVERGRVVIVKGGSKYTDSGVRAR